MRAVPGVLVPESFRQEAHLILQYGHDLPIPIPDLDIDQDGVRATLSFSRNAHSTFIPWSAVYAVTGADGRGVLFAEDVPSDVSVIAGDRCPDAAGRARWRRRCTAEAEAVPEASIRRLQSVPAHAEPAADLLEPMVATPAAAAASARSSAWSSSSARRLRRGDDGVAQEPGQLVVVGAGVLVTRGARPRRRRARRRGCTTAGRPRWRRARSPGAARAGCPGRRRCP